MKNSVQSVNRFGCAEPGTVLWCIQFYALSHILFLMPVIRQMVGSWSELAANPRYLVGDALVIVLLYTWFNRIPEAGPAFRTIWRFGRQLLIGVYLWSAACLIWLNLAAFSNIDHRHFTPVVLLLIIDLMVITYLAMSPRVKTVFAEFPAADQAERQRDANTELASTKRQMFDDAKLAVPIVADNTPAAEHEGRLRTLVATEPTNAIAWFELSVMAYGQHKNDQAILLMKRALLCDTKNAAILRSLCELYRQEGRVVEAVQYGREAIALAPEDEIAHLNLALALTDYKDPDTALTHYHRVLNANPRNILAWLNMAVLLAQQNRREDALAALDAVLLIEPEQPQVQILKEQLR